MWNGWEIGNWKLCSRVVNSNFILDFWYIKMTPLFIDNCTVKQRTGKNQADSTEHIFHVYVLLKRVQKSNLAEDRGWNTHWASGSVHTPFVSRSHSLSLVTPWLAIAFHSQLPEASALGRYLAYSPTNILISELIPKLDSTKCPEFGKHSMLYFSES